MKQGKHRGIRIAAAILIILFGITATVYKVIENSAGGFTVNRYTVEDSTEEAFLASMAEKEGITPQQAAQKRAELPPLNENEIFKYKTVTYCRTIPDCGFFTVMSVEVAYVYDKAAGKAVTISAVGKPTIAVAEPKDSVMWDGGEPNMTVDNSHARISFTGCAVVFEPDEAEGLKISKSDTVTQVMNITLTMLEQNA